MRKVISMKNKEKAKFRVGQMVAVFGIPERGEADKFIGYHKIVEVQHGKDFTFYQVDTQVGYLLVRESRLRPVNTLGQEYF